MVRQNINEFWIPETVLNITRIKENQSTGAPAFEYSNLNAQNCEIWRIKDGQRIRASSRSPDRT